MGTPLIDQTLPTPPHSAERPKSVKTSSSPRGVSVRDVVPGDVLTPPITPQIPPSPFAWLTSSPRSRPSVHSQKSTASLSGSDFTRIVRSPTPSGFEHLDYGADYFTTSTSRKKEPRSFEWEWTPGSDPEPSATNDGNLKSLFAPHASILKRRLGPNETSYYLSSRGDGPNDTLAGVNDMYLHIGFTAPAKLVTAQRVLAIWTEMRLRHTLLASQVEFNGYEEIRFVHEPPKTLDDASKRAAETFRMIWGVTRDSVLDGYLNGPRTLSDAQLAGLWMTSAATQAPENGEELVEFDYWLYATHFLGDGMALHTFSNTFFTLLGGGLEALAEAGDLQWDETNTVEPPPLERLPPAMESRIATPEQWGRFAWAAARVEFQRNQGQLIGGQTFPRRKMGDRKTIVPTIAFSAAETSAILKKCKANGCTIAHAVFALANIAHMRAIEADSKVAVPRWSIKARDPSLPTMLYSALNLRPNMTLPQTVIDSGETPDFFHLVIGYYNVILPTFKVSGLSDAQLFWHRCRETKAQSLKATKSKWLTSRSKLICLDRERRSIGFERAADLKRATAKNSLSASFGLGLDVGKAAPPSAPETKKDAPPSLALMGVSMLGNLDAMYKHANFPLIKITALTTGSRQRPGAMLMFAYTLVGKLWFSLGYDKNGFEPGCVEDFWDGLLSAAREFLLEDTPARTA